MLTLIFKDTTIEGLRKQVVDAGAGFINFKIDARATTMAAPKPVEPPPAVQQAVNQKMAEVAQPLVVKTGAKRGPKPKDKTVQTEMKTESLTPPAASTESTPPSSPSPDAPAGVETTAPVEYTKEDAIKALTAVNEKYGMDKARECLLRFGVNRLGELKANQFADFVNYCRAEAEKK